jgi:hypothetical protein
MYNNPESLAAVVVDAAFHVHSAWNLQARRETYR